MRLKRELLCAENHLCIYSMPSKQVRRGEGALQTQNLLRVPDTRVIDGSADPIDCAWYVSVSASYRPAFNHRVDGFEPARSVDHVVGKECEQCL